MHNQHNRVFSGNKRWHAVIDRAPKDREIKGAEIGVWDGRMSEQLLRALPKLKLYCIDRWEPPKETDSYYTSGSEIARRPQETYDNAYRLFTGRTAPWSERLYPFKRTSYSAALLFNDEMFDFVFLDGDHSYQGVMMDIDIWYPKVKPGGWIAGHDYDHPEQGEVKKAVLEYFADFPGVIEIDRNRTWFYRRPE